MVGLYLGEEGEGGADQLAYQTASLTIPEAFDHSNLVCQFPKSCIGRMKIVFNQFF